jgi:heme exporter protein D
MSEFLHQGGYAFYVWTTYGLTLALLVAEIVQLRRQRRTILARLGRLIRIRAQERGK